MALRVLLADESSTIKKVFQLALQDFAVDVRPVNVGTDVLTVAQNFKPDIIFADVLLQKRSGYEVTAELKQSPDLHGIPVVLMWSGFMELDEDKFQASHANAQLEKPFDVAALRKLVTELVPRTQNQRISQFLAFPPMPEMEERAAAAPEPTAPANAEEDFKQVSIPKMKGAQPDRFKVNLAPEELDPTHVPVAYDAAVDNIDVEEIFGSVEAEEDAFAIRDSRRQAPPPATPKVSVAPPPPPVATPRPTAPPAPPRAPTSSAPIAPLAQSRAPQASEAFASVSIPALTADQIEKIIRSQSADVIESVVWKVVPELATQIIERELKRLLSERDAQAF